MSGRNHARFLGALAIAPVAAFMLFVASLAPSEVFFGAGPSEPIGPMALVLGVAVVSVLAFAIRLLFRLSGDGELGQARLMAAIIGVGLAFNAVSYFVLPFVHSSWRFDGRVLVFLAGVSVAGVAGVWLLRWAWEAGLPTSR